MLDKQEIINQLNNNFPTELIDTAVAKEHFGGEFQFNKLNFFEKVIVKKVGKVKSDKSELFQENISRFVELINNI